MKKLAVLAIPLLGAGLGYFFLRPAPPPPPSAPVQTDAPPPAAPTPAPPPSSLSLARPKPAAAAPPVELPEPIRQALKKLLKEDPQKAAEALEMLEKQYKGAPEIAAGKAKLLQQEGRREEALELLQQCIANNPTNRTCLDPNAGMQMASGSTEEQEAAVQQCLAGQPNDSQCRVWQVQLLLNQSNFESAISYLQKLVKDNAGLVPAPLAPSYLDLLMAQALGGSGQAAEAASYYQKACQEGSKPACQQAGK